MSKASERGYAAIAAVVNICTPEALEHRRDWWQGFLGGKMNAEERNTKGVTVDAMLAQMDAAGIDKAFLIATCAGPVGRPSSSRGTSARPPPPLSPLRFSAQIERVFAFESWERFDILHCKPSNIALPRQLHIFHQYAQDSDLVGPALIRPTIGKVECRRVS